MKRWREGRDIESLGSGHRKRECREMREWEGRVTKQTHKGTHCLYRFILSILPQAALVLTVNVWQSVRICPMVVISHWVNYYTLDCLAVK